MKNITLLAILAYLCCKHPSALFAAAAGKKPASSLDSIESASSRMERMVSSTRNINQQQQKRQQQQQQQQQQHNRNRNLQGDIGEDYLRKIRTFTPPSENDQRFGDRVASSTNGRVIAITGSELVLVPINGEDETTGTGTAASNSVQQQWRGYVEIHNLETNTRIYIRSDTSKYDPPKLDVALNGDGTKVAVAEVHIVSTEDDGTTSSATPLNPISSVKVYSLDEEGGGEEGSPSWSMVGSPIPIGVAGKLPGLRLAFTDSGETLVVGSRNYNNGFGRTVIYQLNSDGDEFNEREVVNGQNEDDHEGSSVAITSDGTYFASGATGFDAIGPGEATVKPNRGSVRIFNLATNEQVGNDILGEEEGDASGFSVSLVKMTSTKLEVAIGAIFNDPSADKVNAGHVRVYTYTIGGDDDNWQQVGGDIDGENGTYLNFDENMFHISDQYGFASQLSKDGKRIAIGAPYHFGPGSRDGGYYHGKVQLFEFQNIEGSASGSDSGDGRWVQIANDIVGASKDSNAGHSLSMDSTGKTIVVGGPSETGGSVLVYYQDEYSSQPSTRPSLVPSASPSHVPTVVHSSSPSNSPSLTPSIQPSSIPSQVPSTRPSLEPSASPSHVPTVVHSSSPSNSPSLTPSQVPSQNPSTFGERTFQILSTSPQFSNLAGNEDRTWCLEAKLSAADPSSSILRVRPCSDSRAQMQSWFLEDGKLSLRNENPGTFCVKDEMRTLSLQSCDKVLNTSSISFTSVDETVSGAIVLSRKDKQFYFTVSNTKIFSRVRLSTKQAVNASKEAWKISYVVAPVVQNIALLSSATAWQSSDFDEWVAKVSADRAIDDAINTITHTKRETDPSWHVTWPTAHRIKSIKVWNRHNVQSRLINFILTIYLDDNKMWSSESSATSTSTAENSYNFNDIPSHIVGDKVEIQLFGESRILSLGEVQIFGYSKEL